MTDLATKIAAFEHDIPASAVTAHQRDQVYLSLYHTHVPKLAEDDVLTFDPAAETIAPAERTDQVLAALEGMVQALRAHTNHLQRAMNREH